MSASLRLIKMVDIAMIGNIYFFSGILVSFIINKYIVKPYDKEKTKLENLLQLILEISCIMISVYLIRIFVKNYLNSFNPLDGLYGFDASKIKELNGSVVLAFAFTFFIKDEVSEKVNLLLK